MAAMSNGGISQAGTSSSRSFVAAPNGRGSRSPEAGRPALAAQAARHHPVRRPADRLLPQVPVEPGHINAIIVSLYDGQDELRRDNADIEQEKANLWAAMGRLRQYAYLAEQLDKGLTAQIAQIEATDPDRAKVLKDDLLFPVRQKRQDLLTQLAVSVQGYLALDLIRRNNVELIKGVDRATTTTVSALRTAVIVAQALSDQKLVLDQITALNQTTGTLIESTSEMLKQQSAEISEQASRRRPSTSPSSRRRSRTSTRPWTRSTRSRSRRSTTWTHDQRARDRDRQVAFVHRPGTAQEGQAPASRLRLKRTSAWLIAPACEPKLRPVASARPAISRSRKNIGASMLALAAGALFVLGITSGWIGLGAIAACMHSATSSSARARARHHVLRRARRAADPAGTERSGLQPALPRRR